MDVTAALRLVRPCIQELHGYTPGKQLAGGGYKKLNTNENPYPPSPRVVEALQRVPVADLRLYSDPVATPLRSTAARLHGCDVEQVIAGNGSDDILTMIFRTFLDPGDVVATAAPSYSLYSALSAMQAARFVEVPMGPDYTLPPDLHRCGAKLLLIVNPNSPTGVLHPQQALRSLLEQTQSIVVLDEAYAEFAGESAIALLAQYPHLIVTRTFSKSYALAGLRLGLGFAHAEVIQQLMKVKDSYNLDRLAIVAGCAALEDREWLEQTTARIIRTRTRMLAELEAMGLHVPPSRSNFVFPRIPDGRAKAVFEALEKRRILVRYFGSIPMIADSLRVTVGTDEEADTFLEALKEILQGK
jgi:histidinol-phosphate aminotransferase